MKEWLKGFIMAYNDYRIDALDGRNEDQFIADYIQDHPLPKSECVHPHWFVVTVGDGAEQQCLACRKLLT